MANFVPQIPASTPAQLLALAVGGQRRASDRRVRSCAMGSGQARTAGRTARQVCGAGKGDKTAIIALPRYRFWEGGWGARGEGGQPFCPKGFPPSPRHREGVPRHRGGMRADNAAKAAGRRTARGKAAQARQAAGTPSTTTTGRNIHEHAGLWQAAGVVGRRSRCVLS